MINILQTKINRYFQTSWLTRIYFLVLTNVIPGISSIGGDQLYRWFLGNKSMVLIILMGHITSFYIKAWGCARWPPYSLPLGPSRTLALLSGSKVIVVGDWVGWSIFRRWRRFVLVYFMVPHIGVCWLVT